MVNVTIDGKKIQVPERTRILDAARMAGVRIPTLCYWEGCGKVTDSSCCTRDWNPDASDGPGKQTK